MRTTEKLVLRKKCHLFKKSREYNFLEFSILKGVSFEIGCNTLDWDVFELTLIKPKCVSELAVFVTFEKKKNLHFSAVCLQFLK